MPFLRQIFSCNSIDDVNKSHQEIFDIKDRIARLESKYDNLKDTLNEIQMDIRMIQMNIQNLLNTINQKII